MDTLRDEAFWRSQQPHYGTTAAKQLLQQAQSLAAGVVPGIPAPTLQLPALQLPSIQLPSLDAFNPGDQQSVAQLFEVSTGSALMPGVTHAVRPHAMAHWRLAQLTQVASSSWVIHCMN